MSQSNADKNLKQVIESELEQFGIQHYGFARLGQPLSLVFYKDWLNSGYHGEMEYLERHLPLKENDSALLAQAVSAIVIGFPYFDHPHPEPQPFSALRTARYAKGEDYHQWIKKKLEDIVLRLKERFSGHEFAVATDSSPVLERDLAYRAGLGWVGKNTLLINQQRGSYFLIGEIVTTLELDAPLNNYAADRCGTCTKCLDACPTGAILEPKVLDSRRCISYWTIEAKTVADENLRSKFGDWFFGCDICQSVCPWNEKAIGLPVKNEQKKNLDVTDELISQLRFILTASNKELERKTKWSPLSRSRGFGLKRNALYVVGNLRLKKLKVEVEGLSQDERLGSLAKWTLEQIY